MTRVVETSRKKNVTSVSRVEQKTVVLSPDLPRTVVEVADIGLPGSQGPQGEVGPPNVLSIGTVSVGVTASASITGTSPAQVLNLVYPAASRHVHTQGTPTTTWTINHALGGYPSVMVVDSAKTVVYGEINYVSTTQIVVNFSAAFSGYAYLT